MAHPNVEVLKKGYEAFSRGDLDTLRTLFADDIIGHVPGRSPLSGDYKGVDEVLGLFGKLAELSGGTYATEVHAFLADDEHGVVLDFDSAKREGKTLDRMPAIEIFHFTDGKIAEFWTTTLDQYTEDEFWS